jgi:hypothetical protein
VGSVRRWRPRLDSEWDSEPAWEDVSEQAALTREMRARRHGKVLARPTIHKSATTYPMT